MKLFWYAVFGGFAINFLRLVELSQMPRAERPETFSDFLYVLQFIGMPFIGGILAHAYEDSNAVLNPMLAINIGASAPLILKNLASALPSIGTRKVN
jgi:hypothetical protein